MLKKEILKKWVTPPVIEKPKVYLAGPMEFVKDFGTNWRKEIQEVLTNDGFNVFNPTSEAILFEELKNLRKRENQSVKNLRFGVSKIKSAFNNMEKGIGDIKGLRSEFSKIIRKDLREVITSDIVLCNWQLGVFSAGTSGELTVAKLFDIPVLMVCDDIMKLPKWVLGCTTSHQKTFDGISKNLKSLLKARGIK